MFNFKSVKKSLTPKVDANVLIAEIHNEFDTASERLLNEAKDIISGCNIDKRERLKKLGFSRAAPVKTSELAVNKKELAHKIEYYQIHYPNNKFITEEEVERICKKYGLLFSEVGYYIGDIPEKNLMEIEAFVLREEDMETRTNYDDYMRRRLMQSQMQGIQSLMGLGQISRPRYEQQNTHIEPPKEIVERKIKPSFKICAPEKDFDTTYMTIRDGFKLEYDPIVLQPVDKGYLVISKWGLESEDEGLVNEKLN